MTIYNRILSSILARLGYALVSRHPIDLNYAADEPKKIAYEYLRLNAKIRPLWINALCSSGRSFYSYPFALTSNSKDPFVVAVRRAQASAYSLESIEAILSAFIQRVQPQDALTVLGLTKHDAPLLESQSPLAGRILPWSRAISGDSGAIESQIRKWKLMYTRENKKHGLTQSYEVAGMLGYGPVSKEKINSETLRLRLLSKSILENGYQRKNTFDGDISAQILCANGDWRWLAYAGGQHRVSVMGALDQEWIPIRVYEVIDREDVALWPNVRSGIYTEKGALHIFDRIFHAQLPPILDEWVEYIG